MTREVDAYIGLGANLDDPARHVREAINALGGIPGCRLVKASRLYRSSPMGPQDQPDYVNAVAKLSVDLNPHRLLDELQAIEAAHGRVRKPDMRWGPRTLDLDILLYGDRTMDDGRLTIPHPGLCVRPFVFVPLLEIEPALRVPGGYLLKAILTRHGGRHYCKPGVL